MKIKTVKSFLKLCIDICDIDRDSLKGIDKLTEDEYMVLGNIRAGIQNDLGENEEILDMFNLSRRENG